MQVTDKFDLDTNLLDISLEKLYDFELKWDHIKLFLVFYNQISVIFNLKNLMKNKIILKFVRKSKYFVPSLFHYQTKKLTSNN